MTLNEFTKRVLQDIKQGVEEARGNGVQVISNETTVEFDVKVGCYSNEVQPDTEEFHVGRLNYSITISLTEN